VGCDSGYSGSKSRTVFTNSCTGAERYSAWDTSSCVASCGELPWTQTAVCDGGASGNKTRTVFTNSCTGVERFGAWDTSGCAACSSTKSTETAACQVGQTGTQVRDVFSNSCTGVTYGAWDTAGCAFTQDPNPKICPATWEAYSYSGVEPGGWSFSAICFDAPQGIEGDRTVVQCYLRRQYGPQQPRPPEGPWDGTHTGAKTLTCKANSNWELR